MEVSSGCKKKEAINYRKAFNLIRLVGIILFIIIIIRVDLNPVAHAFYNIKYNSLVLGVIFQLIVLIGKGIRWHVLRGGGVNYKHLAKNLGMFYESYALGIVTPGRIGELFKVGHEKGKNNIYTSSVKVLAERGMDIGFFITLAGLAVYSGYYGIGLSIYGILNTIIGLLFILGSILFLRSPLLAKMINVLFKFVPGKLNNLKFETEVLPKKRIIIISILAIIANACYFVSCYYLGLAVGIYANIIWISGAVAVSGLLSMIPISIMGLGTRELVFLYVFSNFDEARIIAFSFLVVIVAQIGGGIISLAAGQTLLFITRGYNNE